MNSYSVMDRRLALCGVALWFGGTLVLRARGQHLLHAGDGQRTLALFAVSFAATAWLVRQLCRRFGLPKDQWLGGAVSLVLPTLLLDPFSSAFFPLVFPNIPPEAAGLFGGWMLACCAGALVGVLIHR